MMKKNNSSFKQIPECILARIASFVHYDKANIHLSCICKVFKKSCNTYWAEFKSIKASRTLMNICSGGEPTPQQIENLLVMRADPNWEERFLQKIPLSNTEKWWPVVETSAFHHSWTPLQTLVIHKNNVKCMSTLLKGGADPDRADCQGDNPLICACLIDMEHGIIPSINYKISVIKTLLENGCDINHCDTHRNTALIRTIMCKCEGIAAFLIKNGADATIKDLQGRDALWFAQRRANMTKIVKMITN